jgi:hypothetical protein
MALKPSHLCIYIATTPMENPLPIQALESKNEFELQSCVIQYGEYIMLISFTDTDPLSVTAWLGLQITKN